MIVDTNPFSLSMNMVSTSITQKEQDVLKAMWRLKPAKSQETEGQDANQRVSVF